MPSSVQSSDKDLLKDLLGRSHDLRVRLGFIGPFGLLDQSGPILVPPSAWRSFPPAAILPAFEQHVLPVLEDSAFRAGCRLVGEEAAPERSYWCVVQDRPAESCHARSRVPERFERRTREMTWRVEGRQSKKVTAAVSR